jgi:RNA polymerase sigma-70 factor, ECF subfamily
LASTFSELYGAHAQDVRRFALYLSGDPALADDIVSETFVRLWHARTRLDLATVRSYLLAIARNVFLEHHRRAARVAELDEDVPDGQANPEDRAAWRGELRTVMAALQRLPEVDRAAVLLRAEAALPYEEIARMLDISAAAARVKVHRARLKLAEARLSPAVRGRTEGAGQ